MGSHEGIRTHRQEYEKSHAVTGALQQRHESVIKRYGKRYERDLITDLSRIETRRNRNDWLNGHVDSKELVNFSLSYRSHPG